MRSARTAGIPNAAANRALKKFRMKTS